MNEAGGVASAAGLALDRPARLGTTRLIAVDGPSGSGKTTTAAALAEEIARRCGGIVVRPVRVTDEDSDRAPTPAPATMPGGPTVVVVSTDLLATWEQPLGWWPVLEEYLLAPLAAGMEARLPVVQWVSGKPRPGGVLPVPVTDVLVLEGVSAGRAVVADRLSALVWLEVPDPDVRLARAVARDGESMRPFLQRWQAQEAEHFAADGTRDRADVIIRPGG
jgi:uridine kinase